MKDQPRYAASCMLRGRLCLSGAPHPSMLPAVRDVARHARKHGHAAEVLRYDRESLVVVARWAEVA